MCVDNCEECKEQGFCHPLIREMKIYLQRSKDEETLGKKDEEAVQVE
jgi:hypothetical protein